MIGIDSYIYVAPPPCTKVFQHMSGEEAQLYFNWHLAVLPARINNMSLYIGFCVDYSPNSLVTLWSLVIESAGKILTNCETEKDVETYNSILSCSGLYIAEVLRKSNKNVCWICNTEANDNDIMKNKPVLSGFVDRRFCPPFPMVFEPTHMVLVQASRIERGYAKATDLLTLYNRWMEFA